jgi:signal transduction histidine kinase
VALEVVVRDNGRGHRSEIVGRGFGLVGVQERVSLFGGEVQYGPRPAGGFEVRAQFPLGAS